MWVPRRTPPSRTSSRASPTSSRMALRQSNGAGVPSSWRPPWLETITPVAPASRARRASPAVSRPLIKSGPSQRSASHAASSQVSVRSN
jgi:hypothetical protein